MKTRFSSNFCRVQQIFICAVEYWKNLCVVFEGDPTGNQYLSNICFENRIRILRIYDVNISAFEKNNFTNYYNNNFTKLNQNISV